MSTELDQILDVPEPPAPAKRGLSLELRRRPELIAAGGLPTVSLLPRELKAAARDRTIRRALVGGVVVALIVAGGATAGATALNAAAQSQQEAAAARSQSLVSQLAKFKDVQALQQGIALGTAAKTVGSSTEIDWQAQLGAVEATMPADYTVTTVTTDSATPIAPYQQGTSPLEEPRAATVVMTVSAPTIIDLPPWLRSIRDIPAYADMTATVSSQEAKGYSVQITLHLSPKALVNQKAAK